MIQNGGYYQMKTSKAERDAGFVRISDVNASLSDFVERVGREPLEIQLANITLEVVKSGEKYSVDCYGSGGGWFACELWDKSRIVSYVNHKSDDPLVKQHEPDE